MFDPSEPPFDPEDFVPEEFVGVPDPELEAAGWDALIDFEESLEAERLTELDADATLAEAAGVRQAVRRAEAHRLWLATHWADVNAVLSGPSSRGGERLVRLGGDGTPEIAEFAPAEFGAVQAMTEHAAKALIADALDLRHRFPLLWQTVQAGGIEVWLARKTVQETRTLSKEAAAKVDARIAGLAGTLTWPRLRNVVKAAMLAADPPQALSDADQAAAKAGVVLEPEISHGYQTMIINANAGDLQSLNDALDVIACALKTLGDTRSDQQRRATAAGIIANPQKALDLIAEAEQERRAQAEAAAARKAGDLAEAERLDADLPESAVADLPGQADAGLPEESSGESAETRGTYGGWKPFTFSTAVLYYHLTRETLETVLQGEPFAGAGVVRVEDIGPVIADQVKQWLGHANVTVKPVIDLAGIQPVDRYEVSPAMSEAIGLINPADSSPYSTCLSRHQDNDHTEPYVPMNKGGPPGQTDPALMAKMTRAHHRLKTFAGWKVTQLRPGARLFRSPHRYYFLIDEHGTTALGRL